MPEALVNTVCLENKDNIMLAKLKKKMTSN